MIQQQVSGYLRLRQIDETFGFVGAQFIEFIRTNKSNNVILFFLSYSLGSLTNLEHNIVAYVKAGSKKKQKQLYTEMKNNVRLTIQLLFQLRKLCEAQNKISFLITCVFFLWNMISENR